MTLVSKIKLIINKINNRVLDKALNKILNKVHNKTETFNTIKVLDMIITDQETLSLWKNSNITNKIIFVLIIITQIIQKKTALTYSTLIKNSQTQIQKIIKLKLNLLEHTLAEMQRHNLYKLTVLTIIVIITFTSLTNLILTLKNCENSKKTRWAFY